MSIQKSTGQTPTERYLSHLCDQTFLGLWSYANPFKADGKELCDLIAIFENHVFLFFDRESRKFDRDHVDVELTWERWRKEAITKQIWTASGAKRYVLNSRDQIFLDAHRTVRLPIEIPAGELRVHKIIVAHGAKEACEQFSVDNIYGSLGITYEANPSENSHPFIVSLDKFDPVHVLDSHNLDLILGELDTFHDLGIAIDAPKYSRMNSEDFILLNCDNWTNEDQTHYEEVNKELRFFQTDALKQHRVHVTEFPKAHRAKQPPKIGRNQLCPCGSRKKYKRCHGRSS